MRVQRLEAVIYDSTLPLTQTLASEGVLRYAGGLDLSGAGVTVQVVNPVISGLDPVIGEDQVGLLVYRHGTGDPVAFELLDPGVPLAVEGLQFTYTGQVRYSVFQVTRSPGLWLVWIACALIILGLGLVFYLPYRQLWALVEPMDGGRSRVTLRAAGRSSPGLNEVKALLQQVGGRL
jgi:cytochrome c biogenesis protein ResB